GVFAGAGNGTRQRRVRARLAGEIRADIEHWNAALSSANGDQHRESVAERLAQVFTLGLPPLVQDGDVGADGEVPHAHVEEVLRLIRGGDLGTGRHAHPDGRFEHAALHYA